MQAPSTAATARFWDFCVLLEKISRVPPKAKRLKLDQYMGEWRATKGGFYPALRLLLPQADRERNAYGMKHATLALVYIEALGIAKASPEAQSWINWKSPLKGSQAAAVGDFAQMAEDILAPRSSVHAPSRQSIEDANTSLNRLCQAADRNEQRQIIAEMIESYSPREHKWLIRIILKELKVGISETIVLRTWHPDAPDLFNVCSNLEKIAAELTDPTERQAFEAKIELFQPFKPMLSLPSTLDSIKKMFNGSAASKHSYTIETKLDGERMLCHMKRVQNGIEFKWFSRNATDYTKLYGSTSLEGSLACHIYASFSSRVRDAIFDGEMMAYDSELERFESFGSLKTAALDALRNGFQARKHPCFFVFDLVYLNGTSIVDQPLSQRRGFIQKIIRPRESWIEVLPHTPVASAEEVIEQLDLRMMCQEEGLIIKREDSVYTPSQRTEGCIKLKPEYMDQLSDDLDLLIVAAKFGSGKRSKKLSSFFCAIREDAAPGTPTSQRRFLTFCRFGSGYEYSKQEEIAQEALGHWRPYDRTRPPAWLIHPFKSKEQPDMVIDPQHSRIVQVKASEIVKTDVYATGWTLRFPRFVSIRHDKSVGDLMSLADLHQLMQANLGRLQTRRRMLQSSDDDASLERSKRLRRSMATHYKVAAQYLGIDTSQVAVKEPIFEGMEFCVLPSLDLKGGKAEIELVVAEHGGTVVQNPMYETNYVISDHFGLKANNIRQSNRFNIIKAKWILDCIEAKERLLVGHKYLLHATPQKLRELKQSSDQYGDSYTDDVDSETLQAIFGGMRALDNSTLSSAERSHLVSHVESYYFPLSAPGHRLFATAVVYIHKFTTLRIARSLVDDRALESRTPSHLTLIPDGADTDADALVHNEDSILRFGEILVTANGGLTVGVLTRDVTHILFERALDEPRASFETRRQWNERLRMVLEGLAVCNNRLQGRPHLVTMDWVDEALKPVDGDLRLVLPIEKPFEPRLCS
ncbi:ATP dependent DNA ligase domain-containing protein [Polychytrium aggregatum]|uniref:ATP dependent DNA ligase domain-containing protein n=1 Tax=Polychytrium aggregatum TaxID=110093 RepID=UPI0022FEC08D|nr:ATP dependent DNA ligase domain-containing protein [Polychytrium aggregatum]KAI9208259.1 ATP dependent DNA ligase domain-containing protein [Polychytrium aggregatum]